MKQPKDSLVWLQREGTPAQPQFQESRRFSPLASLRVRLMLFVLLAVLPILGIMLYAALESRQQQAAKVEQEVLTLTQLAVDNQEKLIDGARQLLISLADSSEIQHGEVAACNQKLTSLLEQSQGYTSFAVANLDGDVYCSAVPLSEQVNVVNQTWFQQAVVTRDFVIDTYRIGPISGKANLPLSYPVLDAAGQVQGVIVTGLDLEALNRSMAQTSLPDMAALIVIDRNGTILARYPNSEEWIGKRILRAPLIEAILTRSWGVVEVPDFDDITRLYAFSPLRHRGEKEIYLGVGVPRQAAFAQINRTWARNLAGLGLIGLLALGVAWWGSDVLVLRPISALIRASQELRHNLGARTGLVYDPGELGQLALTFDEMAATLEQREAERQRTHRMLEEQAATLREQAHLLELAHDAITVRNMKNTLIFWNRGAEEMYGWSRDEALGQDAHTLLQTEYPQPLPEIEAALLQQEHWEGELVHNKRDGRPIVVSSRWALSRDETDQPVGILEINTDITERKEAEYRLKARARQQAVLADLGQRALTETNLSTLMDEIVASAAETLEAEYSKILELRPDQESLLVRAGVGWPEGVVGHSEVKASAQSQAGYTLLRDEPVIVTDLQSENRFAGMPLLHDCGVVSGMTIVIPGKERSFGILGVHTRHKRSFTQDDAHFLEAMASVLGAAIERKRIEEELQLSRHQLATILQGAAEGISAQDSNGYLVYANDAAARLLGYFSAQAVPQLPLQELMQRFKILDESGHPLPLAQLPGQLALQGEPSPSATVRFRAIATGEERWLDVKARTISNQFGQIELVVNIFYDITDLKRSEQAHRILAGAGKLLSSSFEDSTTLAKVSQLVVPHVADWCMIHVIEEDGSIRQLGLAHVDPAKIKWAESLQRQYPPDWQAPVGVAKVLRTGQSEFYPDISEEMIEAAARDSEHHRLFGELNLKSAMIVPLIARGRTLGAMTFVWAESGRRYKENDLALAEELGRRAALAVENARLYSQTRALNSELEQRVIARTAELRAANAKLEQEMAEHRQTQAELVEMQRRLMEGIEAERLHLAQELHDGPVQDLYSVSYNLSGLKAVMPDETDQSQIAAATKTVQQVIQTLRATSGELRPPTLAPFGLEKALRSHLEQFQESHPHLEIKLNLMPDGQRLAERTRLALFRICQEALNNIGRHAEAQRVSVKLTLESHQVSLVIQDDGRGFEVPRRWIRLARQGHLGLVGMSERAEAIGGKLVIDSTPGAGTVIRVRVPQDGEMSNCSKPGASDQPD